MEGPRLAVHLPCALGSSHCPMDDYSDGIPIRALLRDKKHAGGRQRVLEKCFDPA